MSDQAREKRTPVDPGDVSIERDPDGRLWAASGGARIEVWTVRCFPWTAPDRHISIRDERDEEVVLVKDLGDLDELSRKAVESALAEAGFVLEIESIESIDTEFEIRNWKVITAQGPRTFQTERDDWPRELPGGGWLVQDVSGDLFRIPEESGLDEKSRRLLWAFID